MQGKEPVLNRLATTTSHLPSHRSIVWLTSTTAALLLLTSCDSSEPVAEEPKIETSAVRACIRTTACGVKAYPRVANCIDDLRVQPSPALAAVLGTIYHCVNTAESCDAVKTCYGSMGYCDQDFAATCQKDTAIACDLVHKRAYRYDCGAVGATCQVDLLHAFDATCIGEPAGSVRTTFDASCTDGACTLGETCASDRLNHCVGDSLRICLDGRWITYICASLGLGSCKMEDNGWGHCSAAARTAN